MGCSQENKPGQVVPQPYQRYQLFNAENAVITGEPKKPAKIVLKIDTETGKTWMLVEGNGPAYWSDIADTYQEAVKLRHPSHEG